MITPRDLGLPAHFTAFRSYPGFNQYKTAAKVAASDYRATGICAPPGAGKSPMNFTISRIMDAGRTLYLTINKPLQNQLMSDFADSEINLVNLVGHSSYPCARKSFDESGEMADLECLDTRDECEYWRDVTASLSHSYVCSNIANWVSIARVGDADRFGKFDLLILDEAHNLESILCDLLSISFSRRSVFELIVMGIPPADAAISIWITWARDAISEAERSLEASKRTDKLLSPGRIPKDSELTKQLMRLLMNLHTVADIRDEWVCEATSTGVKLTPVFASNYAEKYLFRSIPRIIFSSATLTTQDLIYLGLNLSDFDFHDIDSGFPVERRPFYYWPTCPIDYNLVEGQLRQVMNRYDRIISDRGDRKGLIHSVSYKWAETISAASKSDILTHKPREAQKVISSFMNNNNSSSSSVLCSPIIYEGLDFKDDLARYQFFWKVPTLDKRNPLTAARTKRDKKYPLYRAGKTILQGYGRPNRSREDYSESFILDLHWGKWMAKSIPWPKYFQKAWRTISEPPVPLNF